MAASPAFDTDKVFIAGRWQPGASGRTLPLLDPSSGAPLVPVARGTSDDVAAAVDAAGQALHGGWGRLNAAERGRLLMRLSNKIAEHAEELADIEQRDCGKPTKQARADALALVRYFEFYAGACDKLTGQTLPYLDGYTVLTWREPHGVTGHVIPWNYPMQIFGRSVGAALAAGNACVVKPAEDACLSILRVAELAAEAGLPDGALNVVTGYGHEAGAALAAHPGINHVSFTGSPETGKAIVRAAAENHVPVTLELGGKSPQILFADADLEAAIPAVVNGIIQNAGQTCSAGSRVLIERGVYEAVLDRLATVFEAIKVGPSSLDLDCGPLINPKQQQRVWDFVSDAQHANIPVMAQGLVVAEAPETGYYQAPMLLRDVPHTHRLAQEEVFGPLLAAMPFDSEAEALALANGTPYGLVAGVWTRDGGRQLRLARKLKAGQVFINNYGAGGGVELPFGGTGQSGHRREKGFEALYGFTTLKTVAIKHG